MSALDVRPVVALVTNLAPVYYASLLRALPALVRAWKHMKIQNCALQHRKVALVAMRVGVCFVLQVCRTAGLFVGPRNMFVAPIMGKMVAAIAKSVVINLMRTLDVHITNEMLVRFLGLPVHNN